MKNIKVKYQLISFLMLLSFTAHILLSCYYLEQKVICKTEGDAYIENININRNCEHNSEITSADKNYFSDKHCEDFQFTKHNFSYIITQQKNINGHNHIQSIDIQLNQSNNYNLTFEKFLYSSHHTYISIKIKTTSSLLI